MSLLALVRLSPDFRPAYDPLLSMARALAASDPEQAAALLTTLNDIQPARPEAADTLRRHREVAFFGALELGRLLVVHHRARQRQRVLASQWLR